MSAADRPACRACRVGGGASGRRIGRPRRGPAPGASGNRTACRERSPAPARFPATASRGRESARRRPGRRLRARPAPARPPGGSSGASVLPVGGDGDGASRRPPATGPAVPAGRRAAAGPGAGRRKPAPRRPPPAAGRPGTAPRLGAAPAAPRSGRAPAGRGAKPLPDRGDGRGVVDACVGGDRRRPAPGGSLRPEPRMRRPPGRKGRAGAARSTTFRVAGSEPATGRPVSPSRADSAADAGGGSGACVPPGVAAACAGWGRRGGAETDRSCLSGFHNGSGFRVPNSGSFRVPDPRIRNDAEP